MAIASDVIDTPRLRDAIGAIGDEEDTLIEGFRSSAIDYIERYTGRCILDRNAWVTSDEDFGWSPLGRDPGFIIFMVSDVKAGDLLLKYTAAEDDAMGQTDQSMTIATTDSRVALKQDFVAIYQGSGTAWDDVMRYQHPTPTLTVNRGMAAADIPNTWGDAAALIVRALYDGSAYDSISEMSALKYLLKQYRQPIFGRSAR